MDWHDTQDQMILDARLAKSSPEAVYQELKRIASGYRRRFGHSGLDEAALAHRNEPLINLGLAAFGTNREVLDALHEVAKAPSDDGNGNGEGQYRNGLRIALLSNRQVAGYADHTLYPQLCGIDEIKKLIVNIDQKFDELKALICNPDIPDQVLKDLYNRKGAFSDADERQWRFLVGMSVGLERLNTEVSRVDSDGGVFHDTNYFRIHEAIFGMLEKAPVDEHWMYTLQDLLEGLAPFNLHVPGRIDHVLKRWSALVQKDASAKAHGCLTSLSLADEFRCLIASRYHRVQGQKQLGTFDSKDVAFRAAFYARSTLTLEQMKAGYARDGGAYLLAAMSNDSILLEGCKRHYFEREQLNFGTDDSRGNAPLDELYVQAVTALAKGLSLPNRPLQTKVSGICAEIDRACAGASKQDVAAVTLRTLQHNVSFSVGYLMIFLNAMIMGFAAVEFGAKGALFVLSVQVLCLAFLYWRRREAAKSEFLTAKSGFLMETS
jgi:hypothetical protein